MMSVFYHATKVLRDGGVQPALHLDPRAPPHADPGLRYGHLHHLIPAGRAGGALRGSWPGGAR